MSESRLFTTNEGYHLPEIDVKAGEHIGSGNLIAVDGANGVMEAEDSAGLVVLGFADYEYDNTGGAKGDKKAIPREGRLWLDNSSLVPVELKDIGQPVYAESANVVTSSVGAGSSVTEFVKAGMCVGLDPSMGVLVDIKVR